jgi:hypothetical protein
MPPDIELPTEGGSLITKEQLTVPVRTTKSGRILEIAPDDYYNLSAEHAEHCVLCDECYHYYDRRRLEQVVFHTRNGHKKNAPLLRDLEKTPDGEAQDE